MARYTDRLAVFSDRFRDGQDLINLRLKSVEVADMSMPVSFTPVGGGASITADWVLDVDAAMPSAMRERRAFCTKGKASFSFTGTTCIIRVQVSFGWGSASVYIDGVAPSSIAGVLDPLDIVSSDENGNIVSGYHDYVVADNLTNTTHTVDLYVDNAAGAVFVMSCAKYATGSELYLETDLYINPFDDNSGTTAGMPAPNNVILQSLCDYHNRLNVTVKNLSPNTVYNAQFGINTTIAPVDTVASFSPSVTTIPPLSGVLIGSELVSDYAWSSSFPLLPHYYVAEGVADLYYAVSGEYSDPAGTITHSNSVSIPLTSNLITYTGSWSTDSVGGEVRYFNNQTTGKMTFTARGVLTLRVQRDWGWGSFDVYKNGVLFLANQSCGADTDPTPYYLDITIGDLGAAPCTVEVRNKANNYIVFTGVRYTYDATFSAVNENIHIRVNKKHISAKSPLSYTRQLPTIVNGKLSAGIAYPSDLPFDPVAPSIDAGLTGFVAQARFPTYGICYQNGFDEQLKTYDIVVTDPYATSNSKMDAFRDEGCRVLLYVSFGEEGGTRANVYDFSQAANLPWSVSTAGAGVGSGVGGYAGYYCKGGNGFGEQSECVNDNARNGSKTCALSRSEYFSGVGRCSKACTHDSRAGYETQQAGGACGAGFTSANNWQREAMIACANASCPSYAPNNQKCVSWESGAGWGQDYAIADTTFPDQNGIWGSSFIDTTNQLWHDRILKFYLPMIFGQKQTATTINLTVLSVDTGAGAGSGLGARVPYINEAPSSGCPYGRQGFFPIDPDAGVTLTVGGLSLVKDFDYVVDYKYGAFVFTPQTEGITISAGTVVAATFTYFSPSADGVFMDTVDTVDVYPSSAFGAGMVSLIGEVRAGWSNKLICSNRGFSILSDAIKYCDYVMAETLRSEYNWSTGQYYQITNPDSIAWNNSLIAMLKDLRRNYVFDVLSLNYAPDDATGDAIRAANLAADYADGFLSQTSNILLNNVLASIPVQVIGGRITNNQWADIGSVNQ